MTLLLYRHLTGLEVAPEQAVEVVGREGQGPVLLVLPQVHLQSDGVAVPVDRQTGQPGPQSVRSRPQDPHQGPRPESVLEMENCLQSLHDGTETHVVGGVEEDGAAGVDGLVDPDRVLIYS